LEDTSSRRQSQIAEYASMPIGNAAAVKDNQMNLIFCRKIYREVCGSALGSSPAQLLDHDPYFFHA
jgi:hypothetical protein